MALFRVSLPTIESTFVGIINQRSDLHGEWIPVKYFAYLVAEKLETMEKIKPSKLKLSLESALGRELDRSTADRLRYGGIISSIQHTEHRLRQRKESFPQTKDNTRKQLFFCIITKANPAIDTPTNKEMLTQFYHLQYRKYTSLILSASSNDEADAALWLARRLTVETSATSQAQAPLLSSTEDTTLAATSQPPRPIRPPNDESDSSSSNSTTASNQEFAVDVILKDLFERIINPDIFKREDLFIDSSSDASIKLKNRIQKRGCDIQKSENDLHYRRFYNCNNDSSSTSSFVLDTNAEAFFPLVLKERFNVPLLLPALQDIVRAIIKIATRIPAIFDLPQQGGNKGRGQRLLLITPTETEDCVYANAKQYMPKLINAAAGEDTAFKISRRINSDQSPLVNRYSGVCRCL
jgi:hypothetical protein